MAAAQLLSDAVVNFALDGRFPDDVTKLPPVSQTDLAPAVESLSRAKVELETEIHTINEETKEEVSSWEKNAKSLQEDIIRSKTIANDIVRQSEAPETSGEAIEDAEEKADFLNREVQYSQQLFGVLKGIQYVGQMLNDAEKASNERRILDSLRLLERSWVAIDELGVSKSCRVMRLLDIRSFELKSQVHAVFDRVWKEMVQVDMETSQVAIYDTLSSDQMTMADAVIGLKAFKEVDERMEQLWHNLDTAIFSPRMSTTMKSLPKIHASGNTLELDGRADRSTGALLSDLEKAFTLIAQKLPPELLLSLCGFMMGDIIPRLIESWLIPAVPSSLDDLASFEQMIEEAGHLCTVLEEHRYTEFEELRAWVDNAPETWLRTSRDSALATIRNKLTTGIGQPKQVEKIEKQMVSLSEGRELATTGAGAAAGTNEWDADWGDAWDADEQANDKTSESKAAADIKKEKDATAVEDDGADAWGWGDDGEEPTDESKEAEKKTDQDDGDDDSAAAWGWGDEDSAQEPAPEPAPKAAHQPATTTPVAEETRELIFKETYSISSTPEPVLELIFAILEDAAILTQGNNEHGHVAATAPGLFSVPTSVLALFRAIAPHYYAPQGGGNMFLYNDSLYLADRLKTFSSEWQQREDITSRAKSMLQLDGDAQSLRHFANRTYAHEMNVQKTVLRDLLGGSQSLTQQDEWESAVEAGTARIRAMAATWEPILARSVWSQAIGALAEALAAKLITDVLEMSSIGQDDAYSIAKFIATATELDDLFLPSRLAGEHHPKQEGEQDEVPTTSQYAPSWLRLKYLSEVLQSNLNEVKFLWLDSELSLYFSVTEVVDLIEASFENNARTREAIREIQAKPNPLE